MHIPGPVLLTGLFPSPGPAQAGAALLHKGASRARLNLQRPQGPSLILCKEST
ncbi:hypothetical protein DESPIG_01729 [Desulfovibrio piger ATCC 29098]|uniref:Uncharacterized protein n=1 Tax=Desulfovibrio piger ATCC 29098 TaxID=411464 RepID=B6WUH0_9BACT|nr:hypothetical protein DESPIG_01729 [Desulfovibrio piger ATCC 29098]